MNKPISPLLRDRASLTAGAVSISFMPVFVRMLDIGPSVIGFYRMLIGAVVIGAVAGLTRSSSFAGWNLTTGILWMAGVFLGLDMVYWHQSIHLIGPGLATILGNFQVFFLAAAGMVVFGERPGLRYFTGVVIAVVGLGLLVGIHDGVPMTQTTALGVTYGLVTAVFYAGHTLFMKLSMGEKRVALSPWGTMLNISLAACLTFASVGILRGESFTLPGIEAVAWLAGLGIIGQVFGWVLIARGIRTASASLAGLVLLLQPTLAFIWDIAFFDRPVTPSDAVGAALALTGIYFGLTRRTRRSVES